MNKSVQEKKEDSNKKRPQTAVTGFGNRIRSSIPAAAEESAENKDKTFVSKLKDGTSQNIEAAEGDGPARCETSLGNRPSTAQAPPPRPKTSLGFSRPKEETLVFKQRTPFRSFQELKDLTHIDKLTDNVKAEKRAEVVKIREIHRLDEEILLQKKINLFYSDLEQLKAKLKNDDSSGLPSFKINAWM